MDIPGMKTDSPTPATPLAGVAHEGYLQEELRGGGSKPMPAAGLPNAVKNQGGGTQPNDSGSPPGGSLPGTGGAPSVSATSAEKSGPAPQGDTPRPAL